MTVPVFIGTTQLAAVLGWGERRTRRWLRAAGVGVQLHGRWFTTIDRLRERVPEAAEEIERRLVRQDGQEAAPW